MATRSKTKVYLLGSYVSELTGAKLLSNRQVLGLLLRRHINEHKDVHFSATEVLLDVAEYWNRARIPVRAAQHSIKKLEKLFQEWKMLKRHSKRTSQCQKQNEATFVNKLEDIFDIAHAEALSKIKIPEDKAFLEAQRQKSRRGIMGGVDTALTAKEKRARQRHDEFTERRKRARHEQEASSSVAVLESSSSSNSSDTDNSSSGTEEHTTAPSKLKRAKLNIVTAGLAAALDRTGMSSRRATYVLTEAATSLGHSPADMAINRMSIHRQRIKHRTSQVKHLKEELHSDVPLVVSWDGKMMEDLTTKQCIDRLPILVSANGVSQLLGVPKICSATGEAQASAVMNILTEWKLCDRVKAMCFDTTASNTGHRMGACTLLEEKMKTGILHLACRHHIMELLLAAAFQKTVGGCCGPDVLLFKRFRGQWATIDKTNFQAGSSDKYVEEKVCLVRQDVLSFAYAYLQSQQVRDDYREFLELSVIFLGAVPIRGTKFLAPGGMHHARWLSKALYAIKMWMFRSQLKLTKREVTGLRDLAVFCVCIYLKAWFTAPLVLHAPYNDFQLMNSLNQYSSVHPGIAAATIKKLLLHLWYLSKELVSLAFFDDRVSSSTKQLMVTALRSPSRHSAHKRLTTDVSAFSQPDKLLEQFVNKFLNL